jgi:hypothetical protein
MSGVTPLVYIHRFNIIFDPEDNRAQCHPCYLYKIDRECLEIGEDRRVYLHTYTIKYSDITFLHPYVHWAIEELRKTTNKVQEEEINEFVVSNYFLFN